MSTVPNSLFYNAPPIEIGEACAPTDRVPAQLSTYHATLINPRGITADNFIEFAGRFTTLVGFALGECVSKMSTSLEAGGDTRRDKSGHIIPANEQENQVIVPANRATFAALFAKANKIGVQMYPVFSGAHSHNLATASLVFSKQSPKALSFYASGRSMTTGVTLAEALAKNMFFVKESAPRGDLDVSMDPLRDASSRCVRTKRPAIDSFWPKF